MIRLDDSSVVALSSVVCCDSPARANGQRATERAPLLTPQRTANEGALGPATANRMAQDGVTSSMTTPTTNGRRGDVMTPSQGKDSLDSTDSSPDVVEVRRVGFL